MASVLLVDDHSTVSFTMSMALRAEGMRVEVAPLDSVEAVLSYAEELRPDVVLLDLDLGRSIGDGRELVAPLADLAGQVVIFTGAMDFHRIAECLERGAGDFVIKSEPFPTVLAAVTEAVSGGARLRPAQRERLLGDLARHRRDEAARLGGLQQLTNREREVLAALMDGQQAETIAASSGLSETTIRSQIRGVLIKLGVGSQLAAVATARRAGWAPDSFAIRQTG
jgi:DNA-binding NarL/FixJ family response regulator